MEGILAAITLVDGIVQAYKAFEKVKTLPIIFEKVVERLPLVRSTLERASKTLDKRPMSDEATDTAIGKCKEKLELIKAIFDSIKDKAKDYDESKEKGDWFVATYKAALLRLGKMRKANRVEDLMSEVLDQLTTLSTKEIFQISDLTHRLAEEKEKLEKLAEKEPSLPDDEFEESSSNINNQTNRDNAFGTQANKIETSYQKSIHNDARDNRGTVNFENHFYRSPHRFTNIDPTQKSPFIGRRQLLDKVLSLFQMDREHHKDLRVVVLFGISGLGKSRIAMQFCLESYEHGVRGVFWVDAKTEKSTENSYKEIARRMSDKKMLDGLSPESVTWRSVTHELETWSDPWLLVFSNCNDPRHLNNIPKYIPAGKNGSILITTTWHDTSREDVGWKHIEVPSLTEDEALKLLQQEDKVTLEDVKLGGTIVRLLGFMPHAILDARARVKQRIASGHSDAGRCTRILKALKEDLEHPIASQDPGVHEVKWYAPYETALDFLDTSIRETAENLLTTSAYFGQTMIAEDFFRQCHSRELYQGAVHCWLETFRKRDGGWAGHHFQHVVRELCYRGLAHYAVSPKTPETLRSVAQPLMAGVSAEGIHLPNPITSTDVNFHLHPVVRQWLRFRNRNTTISNNNAAAIVANYIKTVDMNAMSLETRLDICTHIEAITKEPNPYLNNGFGLRDDGTNRIPFTYSFSKFCREFSRLRTAIELLQDMLSARDLGPNPISDKDPNNLMILLELAETIHDNGELKTAEKQFTHILNTLDEVENSATEKQDSTAAMRCRALIGRANARGAQGPTHMHAAYCDAASAMFEAEKLEKDGRLHIQARITIARVQGGFGFLAATKPLIDEAHEAALKNKKIGKKDNLTLECQLLQAQDFCAKGDFVTAKRLLLQTIDVLEEVNGKNHRLVVQGIMLLGRMFVSGPQNDTARWCFKLAKECAEPFFGKNPQDVLMDVMIAYSHMYESDYKLSEERLKAAEEACSRKPGYEATQVQVMIAYLHLYFFQRNFRKLVPLLGYFYYHFPFLYFVRTNRKKFVVLVGVLSWFVYMIALGHLPTFLLIVGVVFAVGQFTLK